MSIAIEEKEIVLTEEQIAQENFFLEKSASE